jgi:hypothetical protein
MARYQGTFLLLITPLKIGAEEIAHREASYSVIEAQILAKAAIVTAMGRNAAFERLFEVQLQFDDDGKRMGLISHLRDDPAEFDPPRLDGFSAELAGTFIEALLALDKETRNRVSLALQWYMHTQRHLIPADEWRIDTFLNYWIAFEALAMPNENVKSAVDKLAAIHGLSDDEIKRIFPIGHLKGLRSKILHHGQVFPLDNQLHQFMDDLFMDVLMYVLGVHGPRKTDAYLDGSVSSLLPGMR